MRTKTTAAFTVVLSILTSGCTSTSLRRPLAPVNVTTGIEREASWITVRCADEGTTLAPALVSAVVGIGADFLVKYVRGLIEGLRKGRTATFAASGSFDNCTKRPDVTAEIRIVRGIDSGQASDDNPTTFRPGFWLRGSLSFTPTPKEKPDSPERLTVSYVPQKFYYGETAAPVRTGGRKHVVVLIALTENTRIKGAATPGVDDLGTVIRVDLGTLRDRHVYDADILKRASASAVIPASAASRLNATALVIETADESVALEALAGAYDGNAAALAKALKELAGGK
jgi:hypothetical protein